MPPAEPVRRAPTRRRQRAPRSGRARPFAAALARPDAQRDPDFVTERYPVRNSRLFACDVASLGAALGLRAADLAPAWRALARAAGFRRWPGGEDLAAHVDRLAAHARGRRAPHLTIDLAEARRKFALTDGELRASWAPAPAPTWAAVRVAPRALVYVEAAREAAWRALGDAAGAERRRAAAARRRGEGADARAGRRAALERALFDAGVPRASPGVAARCDALARFVRAGPEEEAGDGDLAALVEQGRRRAALEAALAAVFAVAPVDFNVVEDGGGYEDFRWWDEERAPREPRRADAAVAALAPTALAVPAARAYLRDGAPGDLPAAAAAAARALRLLAMLFFDADRADQADRPGGPLGARAALEDPRRPPLEDAAAAAHVAMGAPSRSFFPCGFLRRAMLRHKLRGEGLSEEGVAAASTRGAARSGRRGVAPRAGAGAARAGRARAVGREARLCMAKCAQRGRAPAGHLPGTWGRHVRDGRHVRARIDSPGAPIKTGPIFARSDSGVL